MPGQEIRFCSVGGRAVAYELVGDGPPLVAPAWWVSHLELDWLDASFRGFWEAVGAGHTLLRYDRPGVGMSDRNVDLGALTLEDEVTVLSAVLDELGLERVTLLGGSSGGCAAIVFAARFPDRVARLVLYGAYAHGSSIAPAPVRRAIVDAVRAHWGLGSRMLADIFLGESGDGAQERLARFQREATNAETAAGLLELIYRNDVRAELARVRAPTLVVHRREDRAIPYELGRAVAAGIPEAALSTVEGRAHFPWVGDVGSVVRALRAEPPATGGAASGGGLAAGPLSGREREVLALVAQGLSDREVAERLIVSPHTVHRHMANIRTKLGSGSRAAAVAEAARMGLL
ncbi:MAG TPA: alpha/beta fold hydrolase [Solirubrobacteraceae bacterium]|jgi:pimeloyl-ACP methyl ester carboxylesterase/DNA-binding CsgD family transcriptional regulator|nr:alpha/beta fold hydrolase [Solirubrobacteraceae bacterium]